MCSDGCPCPSPACYPARILEPRGGQHGHPGARDPGAGGCSVGRHLRRGWPNPQSPSSTSWFPPPRQLVRTRFEVPCTRDEPASASAVLSQAALFRRLVLLTLPSWTVRLSRVRDTGVQAPPPAKEATTCSLEDREQGRSGEGNEEALRALAAPARMGE